MSINSVVIDDNGDPLPINSLERVKLRLCDAIVSISIGSGYPGSSFTYSAKGVLSCTNYRIIFIVKDSNTSFQSLMVTWNLVEAGEIRNLWWGSSTFLTTVRPVPDDTGIPSTALFKVKAPRHEIEILAEVVKESRWRGHLDPENTVEPIIPIPKTPPPTYEQAVINIATNNNNDTRSATL